MLAIDNASLEMYSSQPLANLLKSAGDPLRLEILRTLAQDSFGVLELSYIFDMKQSGMSHHLKVLASAGLVSTRREGNSIFYRRSTPHSAATNAPDELMITRSMLFDSIDLLVLPAAIDQRIAEVHQQRSETSKLFFANHASVLKEKQDLIAAFDVYGDQVATFITDSQIENWKSALEIGPGEGQFLPVLAAKFSQVVALDNAQSMLQSAQQFCEEQALNNISFVCGDTSYCQQQQKSFDCVVINMVLHHTPSPQQIFFDVSNTLKNHGVLIICELCNHNQDWTRQACGDVWLGFEPNELSQWARTANLIEGQSSYFALRNGFQIQIREFLKLNS